jgi:hypothetical protein
MMEDLRTSAEWQAQYPQPLVYDPDGWDRKNWQFSWFEEKITLGEYQKRLFGSTCLYGFKPTVELKADPDEK